MCSSLQNAEVQELHVVGSCKLGFKSGARENSLSVSYFLSLSKIIKHHLANKNILFHKTPNKLHIVWVTMFSKNKLHFICLLPSPSPHHHQPRAGIAGFWQKVCYSNTHANRNLGKKDKTIIWYSKQWAVYDFSRHLYGSVCAARAEQMPYVQWP